MEWLAWSIGSDRWRRRALITSGHLHHRTAFLLCNCWRLSPPTDHLLLVGSFLTLRSISSGFRGSGVGPRWGACPNATGRRQCKPLVLRPRRRSRLELGPVSNPILADMERGNWSVSLETLPRAHGFSGSSMSGRKCCRTTMRLLETFQAS